MSLDLMVEYLRDQLPMVLKVKLLRGLIGSDIVDPCYVLSLYLKMPFQALFPNGGC